MTSKNSSWTSDRAADHKGTAPFLLSPAGKDYLWGGSRLKEQFSKNIDLNPLAETWECSTHPDGPSTVASGEYQGRKLDEVLRACPWLKGTRHQNTEGLPILIKLIDARQDLSVQVHPDDAYAKTHENGSLGKLEMWYVLAASPGAKLVYGFYHDMEKETVRASIENGTIQKYLQRIPVKKDDMFFVPAGRVHAIGEGVLLAEVQESSNLTYRLYDYGRVDKNGSLRPLHVEKALEVADLKGSSSPRQPMRVLKFRRGQASEFLCRCRYFQAERILVNTEQCREMTCIQTDSTSFQVYLCTEGCGVLFWNGGMLNFYRGDCIFVPAESAEIRIHGKAQFLKVEC
ncbi:MAG: class I mannose-6-phosphate isomerase [Lachnospiraceae bacterium]|nr:class I mannose-6-phosphate isomerase [Lachnospiraceae bacterium]